MPDPTLRFLIACFFAVAAEALGAIVYRMDPFLLGALGFASVMAASGAAGFVFDAFRAGLRGMGIGEEVNDPFRHAGAYAVIAGLAMMFFGTFVSLAKTTAVFAA